MVTTVHQLYQLLYYPTNAHNVKNVALLKRIKFMGAAPTCFGFSKKPSSGSHSQYLAKITSLVQCRYRRRTDVVSAMAT